MRARAALEERAGVLTRTMADLDETRAGLLAKAAALRLEAER